MADGGINDWMADMLGLPAEGRASLEEVHTDKLLKLVVFVPETHHEQVLQAVWMPGRVRSASYSHCSFNIEGTGTFMPGEGTQPFIGEHRKLERVKEIRVETIVPHSAHRKVVQAMLKAHPYEEVAYDLYPVELKGRVVRSRPRRQAAAAGRRWASSRPGPRRPSTCRCCAWSATRTGRSGRSPCSAVPARAISGMRCFAGADVLVTGDIDYHTAHDALAAGLPSSIPAIMSRRS